MRGTVKKWLLEEGYGWISVDNEDDVWVHYSDLSLDLNRFPNGFRYLKEGQKVEFDLLLNPRSQEQRRKAIHVVIIDE
ncbi:cold shock domain-containing protein [Alicyclobacillus vulcanalis]|uniref:cold shock domain-containing protein n=1 Tax=Alicyclobacillus vulcanalis TaxID=252246 RepID=UPI000971132A|nr:cold shock domain-containing protein [Alicyclobacillus vulcanalis]